MANEDYEEDEINRLIKKLGINASPADKEALTSELKARLSESHPDQKASHDEARVQELATLLQIVKRQSTKLAVIKGETKEIALPKEPLPPALLVPLPSRETVETQIQIARASGRSAVSKEFLLPKLSLGAVTLAVTWVFAAPKTFADNPFIGALLKRPDAMRLWLMTLGVLICSWFVIWWLEQTKKRRTERLLSLTFQKQILDAIGRSDGTAFSATRFRAELYPRHVWYPNMLRLMAKLLFRIKIYYFNNPFYDDALADQASELALERFVSKGWLSLTAKPEDEEGIDDWYRFN